MDQIIALALGVVASTLQGGKLKTTKPIYRYAISLMACIVAGFVSSLLPAILNHTVEADQILANMGASFVASQTFYNVYFAKKI